jgi:two-component system chemotaxis response regulator CheB
LRASRQRLVAIGTSWGGLEALDQLLGRLPASFGSPLAVVQHRGASTPAGTMRAYLSTRCRLPVVDVEDKEPVECGCVYLAPPGYHLLVDEEMLTLSLEAPVAFSRPSIDVLFETAADSYGRGLTAVVLTGANDDGSRGVVAVRDAGGTVLAQDPDEAERSEMPTAAIATGAVDEVLPLARLAERLIELDQVS